MQPTNTVVNCLPRVGYCVWFTGEYTGHFSFASDGLAWSTAVFDFLAVLLFNYCHCSALNVIFVSYEFKNLIRACYHAFAAAVALVSVYYNEVVA